MHHLQVVLDRIGPVGSLFYAPGLAHLAGHQLGERVGDDPDGIGAQPDTSREAVANR